MDNGVKFYISIAILTTIIISNLAAPTGCIAISEKEVNKKLDRSYEKNAEELLAWIKEERFDDAEAFINHVVQNDTVNSCDRPQTGSSIGQSKDGSFRQQRGYFPVLSV